MERNDPHSPGPPPTPEEFEEARKRELARLNLRLGLLNGERCHTPEDLKLLEGDTPRRRSADMDTVRLWCENLGRHRGGPKNA